MKWIEGTIDLSKISRLVRQFNLFFRIFAVVSASTFLFCLAAGLSGFLQHFKPVTPVPVMKDAAAGLPSRFFLDMMAMELPQLDAQPGESTFSQKNVIRFLIQYLTNINPYDPKSLMAREVPGMSGESSTLLYSGKGTRPNDYPADFTPPSEVFGPSASEDTGTAPGAAPQAEAGGKPGMPAGVTGTGEAAGQAEESGQTEQQGPAGQSGTSAQPGQAAQPGQTEQAPRTTNGKQVVLIYHSHNRESFLPELQGRGIKSPDLAYDAEVNITKVGKRLSEQLQKRGIGVMHSDTDYPSTVKNFNFAKSYAYSSKTVKEAFATNPDLKMVFDIHRDSLKRDRTTVTIDGKSYAQVYFVVGKRNPNWQENSEFANKIHTKLEELHPGISRGVFGKSSHGNAEYNQSLFGNSILLEIGGPYNTLEEMYRTADLLAGLIADIYWQAEKVDAPSPA